MIIDTHSHLYGEEFRSDIDEVLDRALSAGLHKIFLPNINADSVEPMMALCSKHPSLLYPMIGLHPEDLGTNWTEVLSMMERMLQQPNHPFIGIGEIGLDYYWDQSLYSEQQEAFKIQLGWAAKYQLPLMIHTRSAHSEMVAVMREQTQKLQSDGIRLSGVFHCFGGTVAEARELMAFDGFMLGIGGLLTFKKSTLPEVLRDSVPLERIVVETDSPYLAPTPYRGKRNESAYVIEVLRKLAEIYGVTIEEVASITSLNAIKTFPKAQ